jgi:DNA polymerase elongation subunit (family B)
MKDDSLKPNSRLKKLINYDYELKKQTENEYADQVIVATSEKELLTHMIDIMSDKSYHIISHFNGWRFDEKVIMIRMCLHGLLR